MKGGAYNHILYMAQTHMYVYIASHIRIIYTYEQLVYIQHVRVPACILYIHIMIHTTFPYVLTNKHSLEPVVVHIIGTHLISASTIPLQSGLKTQQVSSQTTNGLFPGKTKVGVERYNNVIVVTNSKQFTFSTKTKSKEEVRMGEGTKALS